MVAEPREGLRQGIFGARITQTFVIFEISKAKPKDVSSSIQKYKFQPPKPFRRGDLKNGVAKTYGTHGHENLRRRLYVKECNIVRIL